MSSIYVDRFKDKVFVITGGTTGIGKATAVRAAAEGAKVVITGRNEENGREVEAEIKANGGECTYFKFDLTSEKAAQELIERTVEKYGKIDVAVNNVGIMGKPAPVHMLEKEEMERVFQANFYSTVYCCQHEINQFLKQESGGVIINNASVAGVRGVPGLPAYNASKHAVNGLTKSLAIDYARYGIRINSVNPSATDTPLTQEASRNLKSNSKDASSQDKNIVSGKVIGLIPRMSEPEEQAASILFLASDDASYITGGIVMTDGGWTAY